MNSDPRENGGGIASIEQHDHHSDLEIRLREMFRRFQDRFHSNGCVNNGTSLARANEFNEFQTDHRFYTKILERALLHGYKEFDRDTTVDCSNYMLIVDSDLTLKRWHIVAQALIDNHSLLATYLRCANNKNSETIFYGFMIGVCKYGLPLKIKAKKDLKLNLVQEVFSHARGNANIIRSSRNARTSKIWRNGSASFKPFSAFEEMFTKMEENGILNVKNNVDITALHIAALPDLNNQLNEWRLAHNTNIMRALRNTPEGAFILGMMQLAGLDIINGIMEPVMNIADEFVELFKPLCAIERNCGIPKKPLLKNINLAVQSVANIPITKTVERYELARKILRH